MVTDKQVTDLCSVRRDGIRKVGKTSSKVSFMLSDTMDSRQRNWLPEVDLISESNESTGSQSSALQLADPLTSSGQTGR